MSNQQTYSLMDRLAGEGRRRFASGGGGGSILLDLSMLLSAALSGLFFWSNSQLVFTDVWPPLALLLGLLVGLVPAEGAFFGWKHIRANKQDLTHGQLTATTAGIIASIACSLFSTFSLYVVSFTYVPDDIAQYSSWLVFLALSLPVMAQVVIYAWFTIEERAVKENHEHAKLSAMGFDAYIRAEAARMTAIIKGMELELNRQLENYGNRVGAGEAGEMLRDGNTQLLNMGNREQNPPTPPDDNGVTLFDLANNETEKNGRTGSHTNLRGPFQIHYRGATDTNWMYQEGDVFTDFDEACEAADRMKTNTKSELGMHFKVVDKDGDELYYGKNKQRQPVATGAENDGFLASNGNGRA